MERVIDGVRYKIQREPFERFDYESIERHLEEMAAQGWLLEKIDPFWEYVQAEPQKRKYAVTYVTDYSYGVLTESQQELDLLCEQAGWQRVTSWDSVQIYSSTAANPVPIETDEWARMETIKKAILSNQSNDILLIIMLAVNGYIRFREFSDNPAKFLSSAREIFLIAMIAFIAAMFVVEIVHCFRWIYKSRKSVEAGGLCCDQDGWYSRRDLVPPFYALFAGAMITISGIDWFTVCMTSLMVILALCWDIPKLKKMMQHHWFISEKRRRKILMAYAVAVVLLTLIVIGACAQPDTTQKPGVIVEESTFIASSEMGGIESGISSIIYEKYEIKIEALYPYCLEKYMKSNMYGSYRDGYYQSLPETEATMWGVDEVCRLYAKDGTAAYRWVLIDENYFIGVHSDRIEITDEEKQILSEKLELEK